ncbi:MAG: hypothetical protein M1825_004720 [Sarcosagium campestre]|nr:MAG: hypothetical protein M1825_004720 [Sarcosagium campestre]
MAATLPRPSRPSIGPPNAALPPLPNPKTRKPATGNVTSPTLAGGQSLSVKSSISSLRAPSSSNLPTSATTPRTPSSTSNLPKLNTAAHIQTPGINSAGKGARRTISIGSFPQPPSRGGSVPGTPKSGVTTPSSAAADGAFSRRTSSDVNLAHTPGAQSRLKRSKGQISASHRKFTGSNTPTLLDGSGDANLIAGGAGSRGSDGLMSQSSPPHSRSSSAQGSDSTAATTLDDSCDSAPRGRDMAGDHVGDSKHSSTQEAKGNVIVSVRVRPDVGNDNSRAEGEWMVDGRRSLVAYRGKEGGDYYYDNVFATHDKNAKVYDASAKRLVRRVMEGYHGTVFAYGMTGTGKTFSMQGTTTSPGVIPLAIGDIFSYIRETPHREFLLRVSYLEIYNEKIFDLLSAPSGSGVGGPGVVQQEEIKLREDSKRGVYASPLKEEIVQSPTQLLRVIARGDLARRTYSTQYNSRSSRSHAVVQIVVESRERLPTNNSTSEKRAAIVPGGVRVSTLSLIDLAGSERAAESKERRKEGAHINKSLLTLGTVIARLSSDKDKDGKPTDKDGKPTDKDGKHLPYRDSKLTRLLQPALSGNSLISILCTIQIGSTGSIAAANSHTGETLNTLKFAARAKNNIVSHAKKATEALGSGTGDAGSRVLLERYRMEIQDLRGQLEAQAKSKVEDEEKEKEKEVEMRHEEQMLEMQLARTALKERIEHLNRLILCSKSTGVNSSGTFSSLGSRPSILGSANGNASSLSVRSSSTRSTVGPGKGSLERAASSGSTSTLGQMNSGSPQSPGNGLEDEDDDSGGEYGDGTATLPAQVQALQADVVDKNRYIATLERRLLQARRSSHSRTSLGFSSPQKAGSIGDEKRASILLFEKDAEIADLKARLDDKDRMVAALRSAARKRDVAELVTEQQSTDSPRSSGQSAKPRRPDAVNEEPELESEAEAELEPDRPSVTFAHKRTKSDVEMSRMLDEMIKDPVGADPLAKSSGGVIRILSGPTSEGFGGLTKELDRPLAAAGPSAAPV